MSIDITEDKLQYARLFGEPVLYTEYPIQRDTVPKGWFCYDLRGTTRKPNAASSLVDDAGELRVGGILSPIALKHEGNRPRKVVGHFEPEDEQMTLEEFCGRHDLVYPVEKLKYDLRPASPEEAGLFYALPKEKDAKLGAIGHMRADFGHKGEEFWHSWWPRGPQELNSPEFKDELSQVVEQLRSRGPLKSLSAMRKYCHNHGGEISGGWSQNYGYVIDTKRYRYCLRCNPVNGDYQCYLTCFDKQAQEMNLAPVQAEKNQDSYPGGWNKGDTCYLITNRAKRLTQPYTVESYDGTYFGVRGHTGMFHRVSLNRMFRSHEEAVSSLKTVQELEQETVRSGAGVEQDEQNTPEEQPEQGMTMGGIS